MNLYAIYGSSGFGRETMPLVVKMHVHEHQSKFIFIDDNPTNRIINGYEVMSWSEFLHISCEEKLINIAIGNSKIRENLVNKCTDAGVKFFSVFADNFVELDSNFYGEGAIFSPFSMITSNATIGSHFHLNIYSYVAHDCVIGDFVTFAPGVKCNGNVIIGDHAYIGTGAILRQGTPEKPLVIGEGAVIGAGAVVTKSVPPGITVVGNPAKPLIKN